MIKRTPDQILEDELKPPYGPLEPVSTSGFPITAEDISMWLNEAYERGKHERG